MRTQVLHRSDDGCREFALIFEPGDEILGTIEEFARREAVRSAHFTALGAVEEAVLAYFDWETKEYEEIPVREQMEVAALVGDVASSEGDPAVHIHCVLSGRDGSAIAGHLLEARVRPTLELFLTAYPEELPKERDPASGLDLIRPRG